MIIRKAVLVMPSRSTTVCNGSVRWFLPAAVIMAFLISTVSGTLVDAKCGAKVAKAGATVKQRRMKARRVTPCAPSETEVTKGLRRARSDAPYLALEFSHVLC